MDPDPKEEVWEVVAIDWTPPDNIIGEATSEEVAREMAEQMDGLALRCTVRKKVVVQRHVCYTRRMPMTAAELYELQKSAEYADDDASQAFESVSSQVKPGTQPIGMTEWEYIESHPVVREARQRAQALRERVQAGQALLGGTVYCVERRANLPKLQKKLDTLNKRAAKIGAEPISLKVTDETTILTYAYADDGERGYSDDFEHVYVILNGKAPQIPGFKLIAVLDHTDAGTMVKRVPTGWDGNAIYSEVNLDQYADAEPHCDHCHTTRDRKQTFIVFNEAEQSFKQIGRQCLADYTGSADPERAAKFLEFYYEFDRSLREARGEQPLVKLIDYLTHVCCMIRHNGYERGNTKMDSLSNYWAMKEQRMTTTRQGGRVPAWVEVNEVDQIRAQKTIEFVRSLDTDGMNEFTRNTFKALSVDYLAEGTEGFVAYSPMFADREREFQTKREIERKAREEKAARNGEKRFVGAEGERITVEATLVKTISIDNHYGPDATKPLYLFEDKAGNDLKWFASSWSGSMAEVSIGDTVALTGTVKRHEDSEQYGKATILTRCKVAA